MKKILILLSFLSFALCLMEATLFDGRKVILNYDGTWVYKNNQSNLNEPFDESDFNLVGKWLCNVDKTITAMKNDPNVTAKEKQQIPFMAMILPKLEMEFLFGGGIKYDAPITKNEAFINMYWEKKNNKFFKKMISRDFEDMPHYEVEEKLLQNYIFKQDTLIENIEIINLNEFKLVDYENSKYLYFIRE